MRKLSYVTIGNVLILRETAKAYLCEIDGSDYWIPKSQIRDLSPIFQAEPGRRCAIAVSEWWYDTVFSGQGEQTSAAPSLERAHKIYRKLVSKYHPDRSPESAEVMTDINELWQAIKQ
jgi:hypothetical protein